MPSCSVSAAYKLGGRRRRHGGMAGAHAERLTESHFIVLVPVRAMAMTASMRFSPCVFDEESNGGDDFHSKVSWEEGVNPTSGYKQMGISQKLILESIGGLISILIGRRGDG